MALETYAGQMTLNLGAGNQSFVGTGFQPKLVIFMSNGDDVNTINTDWHFSFGAADGTNEFCIYGTSEDARACPSATSWGAYTSRCFFGFTPAGTTGADYIATFVSMDANGFTFNLTNPPAAADEIAFLCLGGADITNVIVGSFQASGALGNQAVAGLGFQPDCVIFATNARNLNNSQSSSVDPCIALGWATAVGEEKAGGPWSEDNTTPSDAKRYQRTDKCIAAQYNHAIGKEADLVSFDAGGFTIDWTTTNARTDFIYYIALKGGEYYSGDFLTQVGIGNFAEAGVGFTPTGGIFLSACNTPSSILQDHNEISVGFADDAINMIAMGAVEEDNQDPTDCDRWMFDSIYRNYDYAQNLDGEIALVSWDGDGFTMDQVDADPAQNEVVYLVFGEPTPAPPAGAPALGSERYRIALGVPDESFVEFPEAPRIHHDPGDERWTPPAFP